MADPGTMLAGSALRVGFISPVDSLDPDALSGMPFRMRLAIQARGFEIVSLDRPPGGSSLPLLPESIRRRIPWTLREMWRTSRSRVAGGMERLNSARYERERLDRARLCADRLSEQIRLTAPDVLFGCCISTMLYGLETDVPIVYFSDATARIINETYPAYQARSPGYKRVCDAFERETMSRVAFAAFASEEARESAVIDYGLDRDRSRVVPMGAHLTRVDGTTLRNVPFESLPSRDDLRLCIIASDPRRKRVSLAVRATELLVRMGWNATLIHIGASCRSLRRSRVVHSLGPLRLSRAADRALMHEALSTSHAMILPSVGEAYGIAPCEAAHFGRPSVVSAAGGLPEVVIDGRTGLVLSMDATAQDYAMAIEGLVDNADRYRHMCRAAELRARERLNWESWAEGIVPLLERAAGRCGWPSVQTVAVARRVCGPVATVAQAGAGAESTVYHCC